MVGDRVGSRAWVREKLAVVFGFGLPKRERERGEGSVNLVERERRVSGIRSKENFTNENFLLSFLFLVCLLFSRVWAIYIAEKYLLNV